MRVFRDTAKPGITNLKITSACSALGIQLYREDSFDLDQVFVDLRVDTVHGPFYLAEKMPLAALFEAESWGEGYFRNNHNGATDLCNITDEVDGMIDISRKGSFDFTTGSSLVLSLYSTEANVVFDELTVDTYSVPFSTTDLVTFVPMPIDSGTTRDLGLAGATAILIPHQMVKSLRIKYAVDTQPFEIAELKRIARKLNDVASVGTAVNGGAAKTVYGFRRFIKWNVEAAVSMSITPADNAGAFSIFVEKPVDSL